MFTGIIRHLGTVKALAPTADNGQELVVATSLADSVRPGDSIAVNGACLTVLATDIPQKTITFRLMRETITKTSLARLRADSRLNLEAPLRAGQSLDGHFVLGHVDGVATVSDVTPSGGDMLFRFTPHSPSLLPYFISKGSVTIDGISLTVVDVLDDSFTVSVMPYTLEHTTLGQTARGDWVNIEADVLGKYVVSLLERRQHAANQSSQS